MKISALKSQNGALYEFFQVVHIFRFVFGPFTQFWCTKFQMLQKNFQKSEVKFPAVSNVAGRVGLNSEEMP